jgi:hypothetical protein
MQGRGELESAMVGICLIVYRSPDAQASSGLVPCTPTSELSAPNPSTLAPGFAVIEALRFPLVEIVVSTAKS